MIDVVLFCFCLWVLSNIDSVSFFVLLQISISLVSKKSVSSHFQRFFMMIETLVNHAKIIKQILTFYLQTRKLVDFNNVICYLSMKKSKTYIWKPWIECTEAVFSISLENDSTLSTESTLKLNIVTKEMDASLHKIFTSV